MERPRNVPADAIFDSIDNVWEQGTRNSKGEKTGEWKYWAADTGNYFCNTFFDDVTRVFSYTRFHPDGTWSQKGTLVNDVPEGMIHSQKSEHPTTEDILTEPEYENVFRVVCEYREGQIIWQDYFNKNGEQIDLNGDPATTIPELAANFPDSLIPDELLLLLSFENDHGKESYCQHFSLYAEGRYSISTYSDDEEFLKRLMPFATADGAGSVYAIWDDGSGRPFNKMPVVVFGDEGGVNIAAADILELMHLLTYDANIGADYKGVVGFERYEDDEPSQYIESYRQWMKDTFDLDEISDPNEKVRKAQEEYKPSFDAWFAKYVS